MKEEKFIEARCIGEEWEKEYQRKLMPVEEVVKLVKSGDRLVAPFFVGRQIGEALAARKGELKNVTIHSSAPGERTLGVFLEEGMDDVFYSTAEIYIGNWAREAPLGSDAKYLQFWPGTFSAMMKPFDERPEECPFTIDIALVVVSPPDKDGFCSFGSALWNKRSYCKRARHVIAEVNDSLIRTGGTNFIHISEIDRFIESDPNEIDVEDMDERERFALFDELLAEAEPEVRRMIKEVLPEIDRPRMQQIVVENLVGEEVEEVRTRLDALKQRLGIGEPDPVGVAIAGYVSELVKDGDTFQLGTGFPSQRMIMLGAFDNKHDLGFYSEMAARGLGEIVQRGVITGKYKTFHPGKVTVSAFTGVSQEDLDIIDGNPVFEQYDSEFILDIRNITQNDNFVAINNALAVDLTGQINAETGIGPRMINGHGGQPEMHMGGVLSRGGRSLTLLPSTALENTVSRIVPQLDKGAVVTVPRYFADYVVTEYGIASLMGRDCRQRAEALINIAHPDFRAELRKAAKSLFYP